MNFVMPLLRQELNQWIAIMITSGNYEKNFYEGVLTEVNEKSITIELWKEYYMSFEYSHFILATPLNRYQ